MVTQQIKDEKKMCKGFLVIINILYVFLREKNADNQFIFRIVKFSSSTTDENS